MDKLLTFSAFLAANKDRGDIDSILTAGIEHGSFPGTEDVNNLFAVSQHFIKNATQDPQDILEALVVAYQRWILQNLQQTARSVERCIAANRVVFVEDARHRATDATLWTDLNHVLVSLTGNIQDFAVMSNYTMLNRDLYKKLR